MDDRTGVAWYNRIMAPRDPQDTQLRSVYGPVPSRRLGLSLGIDLMGGRKICCYDCLYCQVGPTVGLTHRRLDPPSVAPPEEIVEETRSALARGPEPEVITLAGSGEPTLYGPLEQLVQGLRGITDLPLALLTNGALLHDEEVARAALLMDQVYPSLDAADEETWRCINRPASALDFSRVVEGVRSFCSRYVGSTTPSGRRAICRLEMMIVRGVNDSPTTLAKMVTLARQLELDGVDLNTVVRPSAHSAERVSPEQMERTLTYFTELDTRVVVSQSLSGGDKSTDGEGVVEHRILSLLARRPCTALDVAQGLGLKVEDVSELCELYLAEGKIMAEVREGGVYFTRVPGVSQ